MWWLFFVVILFFQLKNAMYTIAVIRGMLSKAILILKVLGISCFISHALQPPSRRLY